MLATLLVLMALAGRNIVLTTGVAGRAVEASTATLISLTSFAFAPAASAFGQIVNYTGKCKGCGRGHCAAAARRVQVRVARPGGAPQGFDAIVSGDRVLLESGLGFAAACACGKRVVLQRVQGRKGKNHECNAKCMASTGPSCECRCRGANHGLSFASPSPRG